MMIKHTPGPWWKSYDWGSLTIEATSPTEPGKAFVVASAISERDLPLLLAAPELLAALQELRYACTDKAEAMADAAISKALNMPHNARANLTDTAR
jgi:hypothetical protein